MRGETGGEREKYSSDANQSSKRRNLNIWGQFRSNGNIDANVTHKVRESRSNSVGRSVGVLCNKRMPIKLKSKFCRTVVRPAVLYGTGMLGSQSKPGTKDAGS